MQIDPWTHYQTVSDVYKNWIQVAGVIGAVFIYYKWLFERRDRSTQVLFELETRFSGEQIQKGAALLEQDEAYRGIRFALIKAALPADEVVGTEYSAHSGNSGDDVDLKSLDTLLRFYVLLLGIREAGQVPDSSLGSCYRYWLAHYFNPCRREFRLYIAELFPTLHRWLSRDRNWWKRARRKTFFSPERFGWQPGRRFSRQFIRRAARGKVFVIAGAGVSVGSGIPTYRGSEGIWRNFHPRKLATRKSFEQDPGLIWEWYRERRSLVRSAQPNMAHHLLVALAEQASEFLLVTQNVDDLHERAGTRQEHLVHIHGEVLRNRCSTPGCPYVDWQDLGEEKDPRCSRCKGRLRPGVVWFDEDYEPGQKERVERFLEAGPCDLVVVVGTSAVFPDIVDWALRAPGDNGCLVEINTNETYLTPAADGVLRQRAEVGLKKLVRMSGFRPVPSKTAPNLKESGTAAAQLDEKT